MSMVRNQTSYQLPLPVEESPLACRQLDAGVEVLLQAVRRYGAKESRHHFRYWLMSDEWPCGGYWKENPKQFAQYYARLVRAAKAVNPELIVGGPADCFPNYGIIAELLIRVDDRMKRRRLSGSLRRRAAP